jgi:hypothetical protein
MDPPPSRENDVTPTVQHSQSRHGAEAKRARERAHHRLLTSTTSQRISKIDTRKIWALKLHKTEDFVFFACSAAVAVNVLGSLVQFDLLPHQGQIVHLLWALFFLKCFPIEVPAYAATGGHKGSIDPKMLCKFIWPFIEATANLKPFVVCTKKY